MWARNRQRPENMDKQAVVATLNKILEMELAGVVRYTHYSLMVFGPYRMPIVDWLRAQATESLLHAQQAGEMITQLGEHPSLAIGPLLETHDHDLEAILKRRVTEYAEMEESAAAKKLARSLLEQIEASEERAELVEQRMARALATGGKYEASEAAPSGAADDDDGPVLEEVTEE